MSERRQLRAVIQALTGEADVEPSLGVTERAEAVAVLGEQPVRWAAWAARQTVQQLAGEDSDDSLAPVRDIQMATERGLTTLLVRLVKGADLVGPRSDYFEEALIRDALTRDIPISRVLETMRFLQSRWIELLAEHALSVSADATTVARLVQAVTTTWDAWANTYLDALLTQRQDAIDSSVGKARAIVESLIEGRPVDPTSVRALLGLRLDRVHLALAFGAHRGTRIDGRDLEDYITRLARQWGNPGVVRYATTDGRLWAWFSFEASRDVASVTKSAPPPDPVYVGIGQPALGPDGFRGSHQEALEALRIALDLREDRWVDHRNVELLALLTQDTELARRFVARQLGPLSGPSAEMNDLRTTLSAYLAQRMRIAPTADELFIHRNTLTHRMERIERLIGYSVTERAAELRCALILFPLTAKST